MEFEYELFATSGYMYEGEAEKSNNFHTSGTIPVIAVYDLKDGKWELNWEESDSTILSYDSFRKIE